MEKLIKRIETQQELIDLLYSQVVDLTVMSKIELGNDVPLQHKPVELSRKEQESRKRKIAELAYAKLNYR